jgi:hypothetical protein
MLTRNPPSPTAGSASPPAEPAIPNQTAADAEKRLPSTRASHASLKLSTKTPAHSRRRPGHKISLQLTPHTCLHCFVPARAGCHDTQPTVRLAVRQVPEQVSCGTFNAPQQTRGKRGMESGPEHDLKRGAPGLLINTHHPQQDMQNAMRFGRHEEQPHSKLATLLSCCCCCRECCGPTAFKPPLVHCLRPNSPAQIDQRMQETDKTPWTQAKQGLWTGRHFQNWPHPAAIRQTRGKPRHGCQITQSPCLLPDPRHPAKLISSQLSRLQHDRAA